MNLFNPFSNKLWFSCINLSLLKTLWEKEKLLIMSNFSFFHSVFYLFWITFFHFCEIKNCRLQFLLVWSSLKFVIWERVKSMNNLQEKQSDNFISHEGFYYTVHVFLLKLQLACSLIAGFLHYFFLASFTWMFIEGIQILLMLVQVFDAAKSRMKYYYILGYGRVVD